MIHFIEAHSTLRIHVRKRRNTLYWDNPLMVCSSLFFFISSPLQDMERRRLGTTACPWETPCTLASLSPRGPPWAGFRHSNKARAALCPAQRPSVAMATKQAFPQATHAAPPSPQNWETPARLKGLNAAILWLWVPTSLWQSDG